jgi:uncharacterized protein
MRKFIVTLLVILGLCSPVQADYMKLLLQGEHEAALKEMKPLAEKGNAKAQYDYALMFETGLAVKMNAAEAAKWYLKSATQGYPYAQNNLGVMYEEGRGVKRDYGKAAHWLNKAADQGLSKAQYSLGLMYTDGRGVDQDPVQAYMWLSLAASDKEMGIAKEKLDTLAAKMTPAQIDSAQRRAREFKPTTKAK